MSRNPFAGYARRDLPNRCGHVDAYYWAGEYEAPCTREAGHAGDHDDSVGRLIRPDAGDPYGDSDAERLRELVETGSSVRVTGRPIIESIIDALAAQEEALADCAVCGRSIFEGQRVRDYAGCLAHEGCAR